MICFGTTPCCVIHVLPATNSAIIVGNVKLVSGYKSTILSNFLLFMDFEEGRLFLECLREGGLEVGI